VTECPWLTRSVLAALWLITVAVICPQISRAQTADRASSEGGLEEIVVTATRRAERLQDVPVSATAFAQQTLDVEESISTTRRFRGVIFLSQASMLFQRYSIWSVSRYCVGRKALCGPNLASIGLNAPPGTYSSDSLWSYELGAKNTLLGGRLQINASLFVIDWSNIQQAVYLTACGQNFVENLGKVQSHGGDVELQVRPIDPLQPGLSVAYVDAKYTKTVCAGPSSCTGANAASQPVVSEGDRLPGAPWAILTSAEYSFKPVHDRKPYLRLDYQVSTAQTTELPIQDPNNGVSDPTFTGLPKIETLQMRAGMRWNGFDLSQFGKNLTDAHPLLSQTRDTTASDLFFAHSIRPRTIGVTATYRYRRRRPSRAASNEVNNS
jgi:outer membrane receptor protein involved in Fe transport